MSVSTTRRNGSAIKAAALRPRAPEVLRIIGEESERNGTSKLSSRQIDQIIKAARSQKPHR